MKMNPNHPLYNSKPIRSITSLSKALKIEEAALLDILSNVESLWKPPYEIKKDDGNIRVVFDAKPRLKALHKKIHAEILSNVTYPSYITGSVKGHDYSSNAAIHTNKAIVITEDIKSFFPSTKANLVNEIWQHFFGFSPDVSDALTKLTTKDGCLPQGGICSSYLANLALWDVEGDVYERFQEENIDYSRYVDDITISSCKALDTDKKTNAIAKIFGLLIKKEYSPKRTKHEIHTQEKPMVVTKLVVNDKVSLTKKERSNIRAAVHQLEKRIVNGERGSGIASDLTKAGGRIAVLNRFHKTEGKKLKLRLKSLREILNNSTQHRTTSPNIEIPSTSSSKAPF